TLERYQEMGASFNRSGKVSFFQAHDGQPLLVEQMPVPETATFTTLGAGMAADGLVIYGFDNGQISVARPEYALSYPNDKRLVTPDLEFPLGDAAITLDTQENALTVVAVQEGQNAIFVGGATA